MSNLFSFIKNMFGGNTKETMSSDNDKEQIIDLNQVVFTTKHVVRNNSTITNVYHDSDDGAWQFLGDEDVTEANALLVPLGEIIELDPSVKDVLHIEEGYSAHRTSKTDRWKITK